MVKRSALLVMSACVLAIGLAAQPAMAAVIVCAGGPCDGTPQDDQITGSESSDQIRGFERNDDIWGNGSNDTISGGPNRDTISGGNGGDRLRGNAGLDDLTGDAGLDWLFGHGANDTIDAQDGQADHVVDGGSGYDTCFIDTGIDLNVVNCEVINPP
ncbi:MAG: calcium-binding protein [Actinomycetota bacterium]